MAAVTFVEFKKSASTVCRTLMVLVPMGRLIHQQGPTVV
jgi:hypothetical protein